MASAMADDFVSDEDLKKFEEKYETEQDSGSVSTTTQFEYGWCLVRSRYKDDIRHGISLFEDLCNKGSDQRDFLFFLSIAYYKLGEYSTALKYVHRLLTIEPNNYQAKEMETKIEDKMKKEGLLGVALVGGIVIGGVLGIVGGVTALAIRSLKKR